MTIGRRGRGALHHDPQALLNVLRYLNRKYNYRKLASLIGVSVSTLSRYSTGKTIPRGVKAKTLFERASSLIDYEEIVEEFFGESLDTENGIYISHDIETIKLLSTYLLRQFIGSRVESVLALDLQAIPIATYFASLVNTELYFVDDRPLWRDGIQVTYRSSNSDGRNSIWIPKGAARRRLSTILVATTILSHSPTKEILKTLQEKKVQVSGLFALVSKSNIWATLSVPQGCRKVLVKLYT
jgi:transcriptional regulator with XRE-family HTH domain